MLQVSPRNDVWTTGRWTHFRGYIGIDKSMASECLPYSNELDVKSVTSIVD